MISTTSKYMVRAIRFCFVLFQIKLFNEVNEMYLYLQTPTVSPLRQAQDPCHDLTFDYFFFNLLLPPSARGVSRHSPSRAGLDNAEQLLEIVCLDGGAAVAHSARFYRP